MTNLYVLPYKPGSKSTKTLATSLGVPVLRRSSDSKFLPTESKVVVNWGCTGGLPENFAGTRFLNRPQQLRNATNKKIFFRLMKEYGLETIIPEFYTTKEDAYNAFMNSPAGTKMLARTVLNGHSGEGIVVLESAAALLDFNEPCDLFVKYIKKESEYRVHFHDFRRWSVNGTFKSFYIQRKGLKISSTVPGSAVANTLIRNLANGYVYVNEGAGLELGSLPAAVQSVISNFGAYQKTIFGLDFGALDIIYNKHYNKAYILEVNTAPGLAGASVQKYTEMLSFFKDSIYSV